jgi:hypothetical protein
LKAALEEKYRSAAEADKASWMAEIAEVAGRLFSGEELAAERAAFEAREAAAQADADRQAKLAAEGGQGADAKRLREQDSLAKTLDEDITKKLEEMEKAVADLDAKM